MVRLTQLSLRRVLQTHVERELSAGETPHDLMRAMFPAGTVIPQAGTKIRALQIISELAGQKDLANLKV